jgi:hypothetical protein
LGLRGERVRALFAGRVVEVCIVSIVGNEATVEVVIEARDLADR